MYICVKCFENHACGCIHVKSTMVFSQYWGKRILLLPLKFSFMLGKMKYVYQTNCYTVFCFCFFFFVFFVLFRGGGGGLSYKITHGN